MQQMKITKLCKYFKGKGYFHKKGDSVPVKYKYRIYEARKDKSITMSKNMFAGYLRKFGIGRTTVFGIIKVGDKLKDGFEYECREEEKKNTYKRRYKFTIRAKKIKTQFTDKQKKYIESLRLKYPNMGYKRFDVYLRNPENKIKYNSIFKGLPQISKRQYYEILKEKGYKKQQTKRQKAGLITKLRKTKKLDGYVADMKYIYKGYKALHKRQVDIKYLNDIPNYLELGIPNIYLYEITFRDFKSGTTMCFYGKNRDRTRVYHATEGFRKIMVQIGVNPKDILLQYDGGAEFGDTRISGGLGKYLEYIRREFKGYKIISRKEENGQVEAFHLMVEKDCFDSKEISDLKNIKQLGKERIKEIKKKTLQIAHEYIKNTNKYRYSSYIPKLRTFGKKSPLQITKDDRGDKLNYFVYEKFLGAYDIDNIFKFKRVYEYSLFLNSIINYHLSGHIGAVGYSFCHKSV